MALRPARTIWTAWLPVSAPRACTYSSVCSSSHSRLRRASPGCYSSWYDPRRRSTSAVVVGAGDTLKAVVVQAADFRLPNQ